MHHKVSIFPKTANTIIKLAVFFHTFSQTQKASISLCVFFCKHFTFILHFSKKNDIIKIVIFNNKATVVAPAVFGGVVFLPL